MPALRQQHIRRIPAPNTSVTEMGRELDARVVHAALDFRREFFPLLDSRAQEMDFFFKGIEGVLVEGVEFLRAGEMRV